MSRYRIAAGTSYRAPENPYARALCMNDPDAFDVDQIRDNLHGIRAAIDTCLRCPALARCRADTDALPRLEKPQELVQAGRLWTKSKALRRHFTGKCTHGWDRKRALCPYCIKEQSKSRTRQARKNAARSAKRKRERRAESKRKAATP